MAHETKHDFTTVSPVKFDMIHIYIYTADTRICLACYFLAGSSKRKLRVEPKDTTRVSTPGKLR